MQNCRFARPIRNGISLRHAALSITLLLTFAGAAQAQFSIDTIASWNGTSFISSFGVPNTATYGQVITVAAGSTPLNNFSFEIGNCNNPVNFRGEVYAWNGTQATGPSLFESPIMSVPASSSFQLVTFNVGSLSLPAGTYVLFASTSQDQSGAPGSGCRWGALTNDTTYPGGSFKFQNNGTVTSQWTSATWSTINEDLAFQVSGLIPPSSISGPVQAPAASTTSLLIGLAALSAMGLFYLSRYRQRA